MYHKSIFSSHKLKIDDSFIKALDIISAISPIDKKTVGDVMIESGILSDNEFVYVHDDEITLFHDSTENHESIIDRWRKILSFIGLIQNLRTENLIFLHPISLNKWIYGQDLTKFQATQTPNEYDLSNNAKLIIGRDQLTIKKGEQFYSELTINSDISKALCYYIVCSIYPGKEYAKFRDRGYITPMEYSLNLSRKANNWAIGAFIIAIISFLLSPFLFNWVGYSTINDTQFKRLLDSISQCAMPYPSVTSIQDSSRNHNNSSTDPTIQNYPYVLRKKQK